MAGWYWKQLVSSLPVLLWASLHRPSSFLTLGVAVASYLAAGGVAFVFRAALSPMTTSAVVRTVVDVLVCGVMAMTAARYVAALIRPGAAPLLAVLVLGSLTPLAGAALSRQWRKA